MTCIISVPFLQRYYWFKRKHARWGDSLPFPIEVEYSFKDTLLSLRPKLTLCDSYDEACRQVDELEQELRSKLGTYKDTLLSLRPKLTLCDSYDEACRQVDELEQELRSKLGTSMLAARV